MAKVDPNAQNCLRMLEKAVLGSTKNDQDTVGAAFQNWIRLSSMVGQNSQMGSEVGCASEAVVSVALERNVKMMNGAELEEQRLYG